MIALLLSSAALLVSGSARVSSRLSGHKGTSRARDGPATALGAAADIELFGACVRSGVNPAVAAAAVAEVSSGCAVGWSSVSALLTIGTDASTAWSPLADDPYLHELARLTAFSQHTGSSLAASCERIATELRTRSADETTAAAERAGVIIAIPLAVCFLPAFLILGLAPIIINLAAQMLHQ